MLGNIFHSTIAFLVALGLLITIHEFGHYWVARLCGIKVLRFSIGFGPALWKKVAGADRTEYVLAAIPLGGYVKMLDEREGEVAPEELHRAFNRQNLRRRSAVVVAGPLFNFILAIVLFWLMFVLGVPGMKPLIAEVAPGTPAALAGMRAGDEIVSINDRTTPTWNAVQQGILTGIFDNAPVQVQVRREDGSLHALSLKLGDDFAGKMEEGKILDLIGYQPLRLALPAVVGELVAGKPAEQAGLKPGDKFISGNGEAIADWDALVKFIEARPGRLVQLRIERDGKPLDIEITPAAEDNEGVEIGRIGVAPANAELPEQYRALQRFSPVQAAGASLVRTWEMSALTLRMLGKMIIGEVSFKNLSGPVTIADYAGRTASDGLVSFLNFLAVVSLSLGVLNLLPIPILDGGHLLMHAVEWVRHKPLSEQVQMRMQQAGLALLLMMMTVALYNDVARLMH